MHTYKKNHDGKNWLYTVGFESADGTFTTMEDFDNVKEAMSLVNYLNGGKIALGADVPTKQ